MNLQDHLHRRRYVYAYILVGVVAPGVFMVFVHTLDTAALMAHSVALMLIVNNHERSHYANSKQKKSRPKRTALSGGMKATKARSMGHLVAQQGQGNGERQDQAQG